MDIVSIEKPKIIGLKINLRKIIFYIVSFGFLTVVYLKWGEVHDLREIFLKSNILWLVMAVLFQVFTYHFSALNYHYVFRIKGHRVAIRALYPLSLITKFLNQAIPTASISGQIFLIDYLRTRGATIAEGVGRAILEIASLFAGFGIMFIVASILFLTSSGFTTHPEFIYLIYLFLFFTVVFLGLFFVIQRIGQESTVIEIFNYIKKKLGSSSPGLQQKNPGVVKKYWLLFVEELVKNTNRKWLDADNGEELKRGHMFSLAILCQCMIFFFNILTLYCLTLALNVHISFQIVFVVFVFTQFISMLSFVPGSLVVYEGGMSLLFAAFGVPVGSALTLALLFRALIFWLPMPIGWLLYRHYQKNLQKQELVS